jgi:hypothetical protein
MYREIDRAYPVMALEYYFLGLVPISQLHGALQVCWIPSVEILKYTVLIFEAAVCSLWRAILDSRKGPCSRASGAD